MKSLISEASMAAYIRPSVIRVPAWGGLSFLVHGFSTRQGGRSSAYLSQFGRDLNLGFSAGDTAENVNANRRTFLQSLSRPREQDIRPDALVTLKQVHSSIVHVLGKAFVDERSFLEGDGMITDQPGLLLGIQTADCIPVLVVDRKRRAVGAFHAGWRGTVARIVESGVGRMRSAFGSSPDDLSAAIGPGIGNCCYGVGEEVRSAFTANFEYAPELFAPPLDSSAPGTQRLDLAQANRRQLLDAGVAESSIYAAHECTACNNRRFFSYRAENGFTGRMLSVIGIHAH